MSALGLDSAVLTAAPARVGSGRAASSTGDAIEVSTRVFDADVFGAVLAADAAAFSGDRCASIPVVASAGGAGKRSASPVIGLAVTTGRATRGVVGAASPSAAERGTMLSAGGGISSTAVMPLDGDRRFATYARGSARPSLDVALGMLEAACRTGIGTGVRRLTGEDTVPGVGRDGVGSSAATTSRTTSGSRASAGSDSTAAAPDATFAAGAATISDVARTVDWTTTCARFAASDAAQPPAP